MTTLAILILATWRISSLLVEEDGPFDIFAKFRKFIGIRYDEYSRKYGKNVVARAFTCVWCISVWVALATVLVAPEPTAVSAAVNFRRVFFEWLAVSGGAILVNEIIERLGGE